MVICTQSDAVAAVIPTPRSVSATPTASQELDLRTLGFTAAIRDWIFADGLRACEYCGTVGFAPHWPLLARSAKKGPDGRIYTQVRDTKGQLVYKTPQDLADEVLAFPKELQSNEPYVAALHKGKVRMVDRKKVTFELPEMEDAFSPLGNMVPFKSMVKGQRAVMAGRMLTQALPIIKAEAPLVQSGMPGSNGRSFEQEYGKHMGAMFAEKPARVKSVGPEGILLQYQDGSTELKETYDNFPYNRKTYAHQTPVVQPGDVVQPGQLLAKSNFTDDQGTTALGMNARVAYIPWGGLNFEDANVISESFAKKMSSEHMYQSSHERDENDKPGLKAFMSSFPAVYDRKTLANFDDDGVVKVGTQVKPDDPLILMTRQREPNRKSLLRGGSRGFQNATVTWDHHSPGIVTDVVKTDKGVSVAVKSTNPMQVADQFGGFAEGTDVFTRSGWIDVARLTLDDEVATLSPDGNLRYRQPFQIRERDVRTTMYRMTSQQLDVFVPTGHLLYLKPEGWEDFGLVPAVEAHRKRSQYKKDAGWKGTSPSEVVCSGPSVRAGQSGNGSRKLPDVVLTVRNYLMLLGCYLSKGNLVNHPNSGSFGIDISQIRPDRRAQIVDELGNCHVRFNICGGGKKVRVYSKALLREFEKYGRITSDKRIPAEVFEYSRDDLRWLFGWLMGGDGYSKEGRPVVYTTTSPGLADDVQRLCLLAGFAGNVKQRSGHRVERIKGEDYECKPGYEVRIVTKKLTPEVNHAHVSEQKAQEESVIDYCGRVYEVIVPNGVLYVRRNGKPYWIGDCRRG